MSTDVTPARDGGVVKTTLSPGVGWERPEPGDTVSIMYTGRLEGEEKPFDSSHDRGAPLTFNLCADTVIQGYDLVVRTMTRKEKARVVVQPEYAYGAPGLAPNIPSNATLVFEMELVDFVSQKDLFGDGSVIKTELVTGNGWERPSALSAVTITVQAAAVADGGEAEAPFYSATRTGVTLGAGHMPAAWEKLLPDMKKGSQVQLVCKPPRLAGPGLDGVVSLPEGTTAVEYRLTLDSWVKTEIMAADSSVIKQVLTDGEGWERPDEGASVCIDVAYCKAPAAAEIRTPKDSPEAAVIAAATAVVEGAVQFGRREGLQFCVGDGTVIDGLDVAIQGMKAGEVSRIVVAAAEAYRAAPMLLPAAAAEAGVGVDDPVVAFVTLVRFEKAKDMWSMSFEEKLEEMVARKGRGNELYKASRPTLAIKSYERALALFDSPTNELSSELRREVDNLLMQCHLNIAACFEKLGDGRPKIVHHCNKALEIAPSNVKALFRRGTALMGLDDYYNAESDLKYALMLSTGNPEVARRLSSLQALKARQDRSERALYTNMFGRLTKMEQQDRRRRAEKFVLGGEGHRPSLAGTESSEEDSGNE